MYLEHFGFSQAPFSLSPSTHFYCELPTYHEALVLARAALEEGEGFIKIIGEVGLGKTMLCRQLLNTLSKEEITVAYIPNPHLNAEALKRAFARELDILVDTVSNAEQLEHLLVKKLCELHRGGQKVVLVIDEAQAMQQDTLEAVRLLGNIETESAKLLQVILFAQPELEKRLQQAELRQLQQRILFSYTLRPLSFEEMLAYIQHRLVIAGFKKGKLFEKKALKRLYNVSYGVPRIVNALCHKALLCAFGARHFGVTLKDMQAAIDDSADLLNTLKSYGITSRAISWRPVLSVMMVAVLTGWLLHRFHFSLH